MFCDCCKIMIGISAFLGLFFLVFIGFAIWFVKWVRRFRDRHDWILHTLTSIEGDVVWIKAWHQLRGGS